MILSIIAANFLGNQIKEFDPSYLAALVLWTDVFTTTK